MRHAAWAVIGAIILVGGSAQAHHGYANFFRPSERTVTIEGDLESLLYANPHVVMTIRAADSTIYTVTWDGVMLLRRRAGVTSTTFKVGDHLIVTGAPARDPASHEVTLVQEVRRPRDGWNWRSHSQFAQPSN